jgi:hypothetical integral membrane protein (TIGR02206 family)
MNDRSTTARSILFDGKAPTANASHAAGLDPSGVWDLFAPYGSLHLAVVIVCAAVIAGVALVGRRQRDRGTEAAMRRTLACAALGYWVSYSAWWNWHGIDVVAGLPLQACDLNGLVAPFALLTRNSWLRATLYFWAFALTIQAFVQPTLTDGPAHLVFWAFWTAHTIILACAVYDLSVLGFRPDWADLARACIVSATYLAVILPIDVLLQANYGFVGNPPGGIGIPPLVRAFGPWPGRVAIMAALAAIGFLIVLLPWLLLKHAREKGP